MLRRFSVNFAILSMILDAVIVIFSLWLSSIIRPFLHLFSFIKDISSPVHIPSALYWIFALIWLMIFLIMSIYDGRKYLLATDEFGALTFGVIIASISSAGILYLSYRDFSRAIFVLFIPLAFLLLLTWRVLVRLLFRKQKSQPIKNKQVIIVGTGPLGQKVTKYLMETETQNINILGCVDDWQDPQCKIPLLGDPSKIKDLSIELHASDVVIALPYSSYNNLAKIVQQLEEVPVNIWVALGFFDLALYKTDIADFYGIPMIDLRASAISEYQLLIKRAFDLVFCILSLPLVLPIMGIVSIIILIDNGRPILFRQKRVGTNGHIFEILKFRTMIRDAEGLSSKVIITDENGNLIHKHKNDPRITKSGRFLRRFSLDELPQIINILRGDMSLVGPRPELPELVDKYQPWQRKRFAIPQGLTGWWQIQGRSDKPMYLHTEDDLYYIQHYSIWLDIFILLNTFWVALRGKGAY